VKCSITTLAKLKLWQSYTGTQFKNRKKPQVWKPDKSSGSPGFYEQIFTCRFNLEKLTHTGTMPLSKTVIKNGKK